MFLHFHTCRICCSLLSSCTSTCHVEQCIKMGLLSIWSVHVGKILLLKLQMTSKVKRSVIKRQKEKGETEDSINRGLEQFYRGLVLAFSLNLFSLFSNRNIAKNRVLLLKIRSLIPQDNMRLCLLEFLKRNIKQILT